MANPNIASISSILGATAYSTPANTSAADLLVNGQASGKVYKINTIYAANINGNTADIDVIINDSGGTDRYLAKDMMVVGKSTQIVVSKDTYIYLGENETLKVRTNTASYITFMVSYEEMS